VSQKPSRRSPPKLKLTDLLHRSATNRQQARLYDEITGESDRSAALAVSACVDHTLEGFIRMGFTNELTKRDGEDLFSMSAPLASFAAKARLCHALGYYGKVSRDNLLEIARIRNIFAHSPLPVTFRTPQIRRACGKLTAIGAYMDSGLIQRGVYDLTALGARDAFIFTAFAIATVALRRATANQNAAADNIWAIIAEFRRRKSKGDDVSALTEKIKIP
jgi:hypothetical protein